MKSPEPEEAPRQRLIELPTVLRQAASNADDHWGILLLAHGAPDSLADIPAFLLNVRAGRPLPREAVDEIIHRYQLIGGGSPLLKFTTRQAEALARVVNEVRQKQALPPIPVHFAMRNWKPFIAEACEYDRSFHNLHPKIAVITNIDRDHLDCYGTLDGIIESFRKFAQLVPKDGTIITHGEDQNAARAP